MSNINEAKKAFLEANSIEVGTIAWREYITSLGYFSGGLVQDTKDMLVDTGNWVGNINDSMLKFYSIKLPQWTLGYDGISVFGQLDNAWQPTGDDWEIKVTANFGLPAVNGYYMMLGSSTSSLLYISYRNRDGGQFSNYINGVEVNVSPVLSGYKEYLINSVGGIITVKADGLESSAASSSLPIDYIGRYFSSSSYLKGQIHRVELIDNDTPSNSITINNVIGSATQPVDFNIYNELTGLVIGEYFNGVYELVEGV